jgi:hypothetical protein
MGWAQDPRGQQAAQEAAAKAQQQASTITAGERQVINALERLADILDVRLPPLQAIEAPPAAEVPFPVGSLSIVTDATMQVGTINCPKCNSSDIRLVNLLDADPADLGLAIDAGATALYNAFPTMRDDYTRAGFEKFAETVIDAALRQVAMIASAQSSEGQAEALGEVVAVGDTDPAAPASTT